ncbi:fumarylacetoacetase [Roseateles aquatilis]|uniref:fumarylacetoacetase n=1 Tax=Roseateles aquatilis TaxID=431061 RepID=A0A246JL87_9BURK|nr:fumarylacetoacetase [Roseateles aquatilis]OWQ93414.1 fumarylacetoacetase [Roseateles aquatilis]
MTASHDIDHTHDPALRSWVASANTPDTDFPIQNLPLGMFRRAGTTGSFRPATAIGDQVLDLIGAAELGVLSDALGAVLRTCEGMGLNPLMSVGPDFRRQLRHELVAALNADAGPTSSQTLAPALTPLADVELTLPCRISDYTDFYTGIHHATTVGKLFRPDNPLLPNYKWVPIGYHGRASSIGVSGQTFRRPVGQTKAPDAETPSFGPCKRLDYELEVGALVGTGNESGQPIAIGDAERHLFGLVLLNDWSARDMQAWEYQPLGPFLAKSFATTISPWVVTMEALAPFRRAFTRPDGDPRPLPYLDSPANREQGAIAVQLEVHLQTRAMRDAGEAPTKLMCSDFAESYWTVAQMLTHHASNGCNMQPGDLFGSGTQSGPTPEQGGSLLELTQGGKQAITLPNGEQRTFLQDGDSVALVGRCEAPGRRSIGFGPCIGTVAPAVTG